MKKLSNFSKIIIFGVVVALILVGGRFLPESYFLSSSVLQNIDSSTYQAVNIDNGDTYFGKITKYDAASLTLTDVYYFKQGEKNKLIKKSSDPYEGTDSLTLNAEKVISVENLLETNKVMQAINKHKASKNK